MLNIPFHILFCETWSLTCNRDPCWYFCQCTDLVPTSNCTLVGGVREEGSMWQGHALTYRWEICFRSLGSSKGQTQRSEMETPVQGVSVISMRRAPRQLSRGSSKQLSCLSGRAEISTLHLGTFQEMGKAGIIPRPSKKLQSPHFTQTSSVSNFTVWTRVIDQGSLSESPGPGYSLGLMCSKLRLLFH